MVSLEAKHEVVKRVLVIDDEPAIRRLLRHMLTPLVGVCGEAVDANMARQWLMNQSADIVLCDINMPGTSGLNLIPWIQENCPNTPVIMLSGAADTRTAISALTSGASGFLTKPIQRRELWAELRRAVLRRNQLLSQCRYTSNLEHEVKLRDEAITAAQFEIIDRLTSASAHRDEETGAHVRRTGLFGEILARAAGWSDQQAQVMRLSATLHDVGKIGVPDAILRKPGKLTPDEFTVMQQHTIIGAKLLSGSTSPVLRMAAEIAMGHHERWDGQGYPAGRKGYQIPEAARMVSIVDVYDALTHDRVYRRAIPRERVLEMMREGSGTQFDPRLLAHFFDIIDEIDCISRAHPDVPHSSSFGPAQLVAGLGTLAPC